MLKPKKSLIAIVDDDQLYRKVLHFVLIKENYKLAFEAVNGADCIYMLKQTFNYPDLIIVDVEMPVMDGFETVKAIRLNWPFIKIISHSSVLDPGVKDKVISCGADAFVIKGQQSMNICEAIEKVLGGA